MKLLKNLFKSKLHIFEDKATHYILTQNHLKLRMLSLDINEYIKKNKKDWNISKYRKYIGLLKEIMEVL